MAKYRDVKIPEEMFLHIRKLIDKNPELGIRSVSEFVIISSRLELERVHDREKAGLLGRK